MPLKDFVPTKEPDPSWKLHPDDTMFPIDRVRAVIDLKEPDRVPINANMSLHAYHYAYSQRKRSFSHESP